MVPPDALRTPVVLARLDANPITFGIVIEEKAHEDVRAVVGVCGELCVNPLPLLRR